MLQTFASMSIEKKNYTSHLFLLNSCILLSRRKGRKLNIAFFREVLAIFSKVGKLIISTGKLFKIAREYFYRKQRRQCVIIA